MPENPAERAQVRQWTKLVDEEIHDAGSVLSFCAMFRDRMLAADEEDREKRSAMSATRSEKTSTGLRSRTASDRPSPSAPSRHTNCWPATSRGVYQRRETG